MPAGMAGLRGAALFLSGFTLLNIVGESLVLVVRGSARTVGGVSRFDANLWWIDLRPCPYWAVALLLSCFAIVIGLAAIRPVMGVWRTLLTSGVLGILLLATARDALRFGQLLAGGDIVTGCPVPFSALVCLLLAVLLVFPWYGTRAAMWTRSGAVFAGLTMACCAVLCPIAQMYCFGGTDYRRPADVAVVFDAKVFADGRPSLVLWDRVQTGCELYRLGLVHKLVLSGGPGSGSIDETEAMARIARDAGVSEADIILDPAGLNTQATVEHTVEFARDAGWGRILAVSHGYHLPRIKLTFHRAGCEVYTVPARESRTLQRISWYMSREVAALWVYYLQPLRT